MGGDGGQRRRLGPTTGAGRSPAVARVGEEKPWS